MAVRLAPSLAVVLVGAVAFAVVISKTRSGLPGLATPTPVLGWVLQLGSLALIAFLVGFVVQRRGWLAASAAHVGGVVLFVLVDLRPTPPWAFIASVIGWGPPDATGSWEAVIGLLGIGVPWAALSGAAGSWAPRASGRGGSPRWSAPMNGSVRRLLLLGVGVTVIAALVVLGWRFNGLGIRTASPLASVAIAFDSPPASPGYAWTRDGRAVPREEVVAFAGPDHCRWQSATFLMIGWPPGTFANTAALARQYVRDPKAAVKSSLRERLATNVELPGDARATGYRLGVIEIYLSAADQDQAIYVSGPGGTERWPRSDPMTLCA
jgi:hypothetical protein